MAGDDRARFCETCDLTVHDLSAMSDAGARALLAGPAERLCVRFNVRRDGMVVTRSRTRWLGASLGALGIAIALIGGTLIYGVLKLTMGIRLDAEQEFNGADLSIHNVSATPERETYW